MKHFYVFAFLLVCTNVSRSQTLTQSADGQSSIPLPLNGLGVSLDIGKTEATIGLNNYNKILRSKSARFCDNFLMGSSLSVKSADGLGQLFSSGDIVPSGKLQAFTGYSWSNNAAMLRAFSTLKDVDQIEQAEIQRAYERYQKKVLNAVYDQSGKIDSALLRNKVTKALADRIKKAKTSNEIDTILQDAGKDPETSAELEVLKKFKTGISAQKDKEKKSFTEQYNKIREIITSFQDDLYPTVLSRLIPFRATFFVQGGINATGFTRYLGLNTTTLASSFQDTLFRGGNLGLGVNLQVANYWLGATYSYVDGDNFAVLKSKEYTLKTTDNVNNQSLTSEKKITGYSGKYSRVETNQLNLDLVGDYKLSDTSRLLANAYMRCSLASRDTAFLKNYTNVGIGLYFIDKKSKFLGGIYVELPDVNNNIEKAKPAEEVNIRSPFRKLTFGIVSKFSLSSILGLN